MILLIVMPPKQFFGGLVTFLFTSACLEAAPVDPPLSGEGNHAPKALISPGSDFAVGTTVTLRGDDSFDPDGDALSYHWQTVVPGTGAIIEGTDSSFRFRLAEEGDFHVALTVRDPSGFSDTSTVRVGTFTPTVDVHAGPNRTMTIFSRANLIGNLNLNGALETNFFWTMLSAPPQSTAQLVDADTLSPHFDADRVGEYTFELRVDSPWSTFKDEVTIAAMASQHNAGVRYVDFSYSPSLTKLAGTATGGALGPLQIVDLNDWSVETLSFETPQGVAFSPDGARLALSHGVSTTPFTMTAFGTSPLSALQSIPMPGSPSLRFAMGNQVVFFQTFSGISTLNLTTGVITRVFGEFGDRLVAPTSTGEKFYTWSFTIPNLVGLLEVTDTGPVVLGTHDLGPSGCTPLWPSPTEQFVISRCGQILRVSTDEALDLTEITVLPVTDIAAAVHATIMGLIIVAIDDGSEYSIRAYNDVTFEEEWVLPTPEWYEPGTSVPVFALTPQALFELPDGQTLVMLGLIPGGLHHRFLRFRP